MKIILTLFMYAAACGLVLSFVEHVSALFAWPSPLGESSGYLSFGIFVVWFPTVLVAIRLAKDFKQQDFWKAVLRACPRWMKYATFFFFGYAFVIFSCLLRQEPPLRVRLAVWDPDILWLSILWRYLHSTRQFTLMSVTKRGDV
jgi:hypothetical protein